MDSVQAGMLLGEMVDALWAEPAIFPIISWSAQTPFDPSGLKDFSTRCPDISYWRIS
jgi:hypothetical protein